MMNREVKKTPTVNVFTHHKYRFFCYCSSSKLCSPMPFSNFHLILYKIITPIHTQSLVLPQADVCVCAWRNATGPAAPV